MAEISKKYGNYIVFGAAEYAEEKDCLYNSAFVTGPEGVIGTYRKIHPYDAENMWCEKGSEPFMFETPWGPVGIGICYDSYQFPELMRYYVSKGMRLHLNPTAEFEQVELAGSRDNRQETLELATIDFSLADRSLCKENKWAGEIDYRPHIYKKFE